MENVPKLTDEQLARGKWLAEAGPDWMLARTVPIYAQTRDGNPVLHGTGVLLRIADAGFLLSAAHVFYDAMDDRRLLLGVAALKPLVSLEGLDVTVSTDREDVDFGFVRLRDEQVQTIAAHKAFVGLDQVDMERRAAESGWYTVVGYPRSQSTLDSMARVVDSEPFYVHTKLHDGDLLPFTIGQSIAVTYDLNQIVSVDENGQRVPAPDLRGISGCGMWRTLGHSDAPTPERWDLSAIRLAGIEHSVVGNKAIKGVLAFRVIDGIRQNHPDLAPAIELVRR